MSATETDEPYFVGHQFDTADYPTDVAQVVEGDPAAVRAAGLTYESMAMALETLAIDVRAAANRSSEVWDGDTAPKARRAVRDTSARIQALVAPLRSVADAHATLADKLDHYQGRVQDYWDSARTRHLPQYTGAQWMSGAEESNILNMPRYDTDAKVQQDAEDVIWLRSEIESLKASATGGRRDFYDALVSAQAACDVIDATWALVDVAPPLPEPSAPVPTDVPAEPDAPTDTGNGTGGDGGPSGGGGTGGGGSTGGAGSGGGFSGGGASGGGPRPTIPLDVPDIEDLAPAAPVGDATGTDDPPAGDAPADAPDPDAAAVPALAPVTPDVTMPDPDPAWVAEQIALRDALGPDGWTVRDDDGWSALVRADAGLQADLTAQEAEVAQEAVRRFLETGATEGTFDVVTGPAEAATGAPALADRLGALPSGPGGAAVPETSGELRHHGTATVVRADDGSFSVTLDSSYEWSGRITPGDTFTEGSWQHGAGDVLTGGEAPFDLSVGWRDATTLVLDPATA